MGPMMPERLPTRWIKLHHTGKFDSAFILAGCVAALGAFLVLFVIRSPKTQDKPVSV